MLYNLPVNKSLAKKISHKYLHNSVPYSTLHTIHHSTHTYQHINTRHTVHSLLQANSPHHILSDTNTLWSNELPPALHRDRTALGHDTHTPPLHGLLATETLGHGVSSPLTQSGTQLSWAVPLVAPSTCVPMIVLDRLPCPFWCE